MSQRIVPASDVERAILSQRLQLAQQAKQLADEALALFCEARGIKSASCVKVTDEAVVLEVPDA